MAEVRIKDIDEHEIDTILAEDIDFEGHLTFKKPLMIKGRFKGEIRSTSALYIGEKAMVEATTEAGIVSSKGTHKGNIVGHSRVELFSTARVDGDITTPDFVVESGCTFNGTCTMGPVKKQDAAQTAAPGAPPVGASGLPQKPAQAQAHGPSSPPQATAQAAPPRPAGSAGGPAPQGNQQPGNPGQGQGGQPR